MHVASRSSKGYPLAALSFLALAPLAGCGDASSPASYDEDGYALSLEVTDTALKVGDELELDVFLTNRENGPVEELSPTDLDWMSSDPEVLSVDSGVVTAERSGQATVVAEDVAGRSTEAEFSVKEPNPDDAASSDLPLVAYSPHDREPSSGNAGWEGNWRAPSFGNASMVEDGGADGPFDAYVRTRYPEGMKDGRGPVHWYGWHANGPYTELQHVRIEKWMRIGGERSDFESHPVGTKMGFMGAGACDGARAELYPLLEGGLRESFQLRVVQQFLDRKNMTQNVTSERVIEAGTWQRWEYELILNDVGESNGVMRVTVDDQVIIDYDNVKYRNSHHSCGLQVWRWNPTWGGSSNAVKSRDDYIDIAEVTIRGERLP